MSFFLGIYLLCQSNKINLFKRKSRINKNFLKRLVSLFYNNFSSSKSTKFSKSSIKEIETCKALTRIFNKPFEKSRPNWLINPETGRKLEIDCYNEELKLGAEFNGIQHYKWPNFTNQTFEQFKAQIRRDKYKKKICRKKGIKLIVVPYYIKKKDIEKYIRKKLDL